MLIDVYKYKKYKHELQLVNLSRYLHAGSESEISKFSRITGSLPGSCHVFRTKLYDRSKFVGPKANNTPRLLIFLGKYDFEITDDSLAP